MRAAHLEEDAHKSDQNQSTSRDEEHHEGRTEEREYRFRFAWRQWHTAPVQRSECAQGVQE